MHVCIDGHNLALPHGTGIATYAKNLALAASELGHEVSLLFGSDEVRASDPLLREIEFMDTLGYEPYRQSTRLTRARRLLRLLPTAISARTRAHPITLSGRVMASPMAKRLPPASQLFNAQDLWFGAYLTFASSGRWLDVKLPRTPRIMHWTMPVPLRVPGAVNLYTLHDLIPLKLPYATKDIKRDYLRMCRHIARHADAILTVSETSKADIEDMLGVSSDRVINTYQSVGSDTNVAQAISDDARRALEQRFGLQAGQYLLFVGALEPRKNIGRLIQAYLASGVGLPLIMVGPVTGASDPAMQQIPELSARWADRGRRDAPAAGSLLRLSHVPRPELLALVGGARALLFPSLYEGFGLPPLEAMLLDTPVLTSNGNSLGELFADAALTVDPEDSAQLTEGVRRIASDDALCTDLVARGRLVAERYSQARYRERMSEVYARFAK